MRNKPASNSEPLNYVKMLVYSNHVRYHFSFCEQLKWVFFVKLDPQCGSTQNFKEFKYK